VQKLSYVPIALPWQ